MSKYFPSTVQAFKDINTTHHSLSLSSRRQEESMSGKISENNFHFERGLKILLPYFPILSLPTSPRPDAFAHC